MASLTSIVEFLDELLDPGSFDDYGPNGLQVPGAGRVPGRDAGQAARILDSALGRMRADDDPVTHVEVLVYRAELAMVLNDPKTATDMLTRAEQIALDADQTSRAAPSFEAAADLAATLR